MNVKFKVITSNPNKKGGFVWKLAVESETTVFGLKKTISRFYYIGGMPQPAVVGSELIEDIDKFDVVSYPYEIEDKMSGVKKTINLNWLQAKQLKRVA